MRTEPHGAEKRELEPRVEMRVTVVVQGLYQITGAS